MLEIKRGVSLYGLRPEILVALQVAQSVFDQQGFKTIITSASDGEHSRGSLHYLGLAIDLRVKHIPHDRIKKDVANMIRARLGKEFDVVLEGLGTPYEHIHIEYQPKGE